jgi:type III secretory pathway lipoprotein EscJ
MFLYNVKRRRKYAGQKKKTKERFRSAIQIRKIEKIMEREDQLSSISTSKNRKNKKETKPTDLSILTIKTFHASIQSPWKQIKVSSAVEGLDAESSISAVVAARRLSARHPDGLRQVAAARRGQGS